MFSNFKFDAPSRQNDSYFPPEAGAQKQNYVHFSVKKLPIN